MSVTLTDNAAHRVAEVLDKAGRGEGLRLGVKEAGCSGLTYVVELAEAIGPDDHVFEEKGVQVVIDVGCLEVLDGTELDYRKDGLNEMFHFNNPQARETCGCGESFTT